jgi:polar amino acid transport system substrate-binding protein
MLRSHRLIALALVVAALAVLAACGDDDDDGGGGASTEASTTEQADACAKDQLALTNAGQLTVGTDKPAFPPYFVDDDPTNGKGFESAVAYAVADELGFTKDEVEWTVVPFNASYAPGPKDFDFDINQISITPAREKAVDFSSPYYTAPQAVVTPKNSEFANAQTFADL